MTRVVPREGRLPYEEGLFIGYRAYDRAGVDPAYPFGHGLGYTRWVYEALSAEPAPASSGDLATVRVRVRNAGTRSGREVVQLYLAPQDHDPAGRPARWLAGFASVTAEPGTSAEVTVTVPRRAAEMWDGSSWALVPGAYTLTAAHSLADPRLTVPLTVPSRPRGPAAGPGARALR